MISLVRTDQDHPDFLLLTHLLNADLAVRYEVEPSLFVKINSKYRFDHVVLAYDGNEPMGCVTMSNYADGTAELKRMFIHPNHRRKGAAKMLLSEFEKWMVELGYTRCVLETGIMQPEAIQFYQSNGFHSIPSYSGYEGSRCFEKNL